MKFIRDIIGEKRQSHTAETSSAPAGLDMFLVTDDILADDVLPSPTAPMPEVNVHLDIAGDSADAVSDDADDSVIDDIAAFFASREAEQHRPDIHHAETSSEGVVRSGHAPTRLVPGPGARDIATAAHSDTARNQQSRDITAEIDRVLVAEHLPDPMIEATFRAARQVNSASEEESTKPEYHAGWPTENATAAPAGPLELSQDWREHDQMTSQAIPATERPAAPTPAPDLSVAMPQPAMGRGEARHGRVKTRLLGFNTAPDTGLDPIAAQQDAPAAPYTSFPVGWLIVVEGAGRGSAFSLFSGVSTIGRGEEQVVRLDFGDNAISRENHAAIAYDPVQKSFFIGHGGKANLVRRNSRPVLSTEELAAGDHVTIGETVLRFVPLCGPDFAWDTTARNG